MSRILCRQCLSSGGEIKQTAAVLVTPCDPETAFVKVQFFSYDYTWLSLKELFCASLKNLTPCRDA